MQKKKSARADIAELCRQAEEAIGATEEKYHQLFDNESDAVMIFDAETGQFEDANQATLDLYGYSKDEFLTLKIEDISAAKLFISPKTVENHRTNIMNKLGLHSTLELVRYAARLGLIDVDLWKE